jgi:hypothetical protein
MPRLTFYQLFRLIDSNTLEVLRKIKVGSKIYDVGDLITKGTIVAGIDFFNYINAEIEGDDEDGAWVVRRIYGRPA